MLFTSVTVFGFPPSSVVVSLTVTEGSIAEPVYVYDEFVALTTAELMSAGSAALILSPKPARQLTIKATAKVIEIIVFFIAFPPISGRNKHFRHAFLNNAYQEDNLLFRHRCPPKESQCFQF